MASSTPVLYRSSLVALVQGLGIKVPLEPFPIASSQENSLSVTIQPRQTVPLSLRTTVSRPLSPRPGSRRLLSPRAMSPRARSPRFSIRSPSPRLSSPRRAVRMVNSRPLSPRRSSPRPASPISYRHARPNTDRPKIPLSPRLSPQRATSPSSAPRYNSRIIPAAAPKRNLFAKHQTKPPAPPLSPHSKPAKKVTFQGLTAYKSEAILSPKATTGPSDPQPQSPQSSNEIEASQAMVSPRIDLDVSSSPSPNPKAAASASEAAPKSKPLLRSPKSKAGQSSVLNALVTKVEATSDPSDAGKSKTEIITRKHLYQTFRGLKMARALPLADPLQLQAKRVMLMKPPGKYRPKTAIFDLDETLVHCLDRSETATPDVVLPIRFPNGNIVHVRFT